MSRKRFTDAELTRIYRGSLRSLLEDVLFEETALGLRARVPKKSAGLLAGKNLTVGDLGGSALPPGYNPAATIHAWWDASAGGFVFIPKDARPLPLYSKLQRLPVTGARLPRSADGTQAQSRDGAHRQTPGASKTGGKHAECGHCGATLWDEESRRLGFGPECRRHYSVAELKRRSTHRNATRTREWVENVTLEEQMVDGLDRRL